MRLWSGARQAASAGLLAVLMAGASGAQEVPVAPPHPIEGTWRTVLNSEITIAPCPEGFCGALSKIVDFVQNVHDAELVDYQIDLL